MIKRLDTGPKLIGWPATIVALLFIVFGVVLLGGCTRQISNEEIVEQTLLCEESGLEARLRYGGWTLEPKDVVCIPRNKK